MITRTQGKRLSHTSSPSGTSRTADPTPMTGADGNSGSVQTGSTSRLAHMTQVVKSGFGSSLTPRKLLLTTMMAFGFVTPLAASAAQAAETVPAPITQTVSSDSTQTATTAHPGTTQAHVATKKKAADAHPAAVASHKAAAHTPAATTKAGDDDDHKGTTPAAKPGEGEATTAAAADDDKKAGGDDEDKPLVTSGHLAHGHIDDHVSASNGIDAGDYPDPLDNFNGAFGRVEVNRDFKITGLTLKTDGRDGDPGTHAGIELGGATLRLDESLHLNFNPGIGGSRGAAGVLDLDNTLGVNLLRGSVSHTTQFGTGDKASTLTYGVHGYLQATDEFDINYTRSTNPSDGNPNGLTHTNTFGVGGRVGAYADYQTPTKLGKLDLKVEAGTEYNVTGQTYGNHSNARIEPYVSATQSLTMKHGVTVGTREDLYPSTGAYRVAGFAEKDLNEHTTIGAYVGYEHDAGRVTAGPSNGAFAGVGITFKW